ncbi:pseudaminic acid cytidylyltransferase [Microbulbifer discodermiae]|uniref:pseudaminic acid cytidylyltransferase n=1 Tax=Microbulbifer sp. 2201CG32-9 TaxID=3232309 RepID=UPI00345C525B
MKIAVIPARGGSKRIPGKNIRSFFGRPMISWSIEAARNSRCFDEIIVSTDDQKIAEVAESYGACIPFMRPDNLADDFTGTIPVIKHAIEWISNNIASVEFACCLYATAPFVTPADLRSGMEILKNSSANFAFSVTSFAYPIQRALRIMDCGAIEMFSLENFSIRSQDLEEAFHDAGQFYWGRAEAWRREDIIFSNRSLPVKIPRYRVQDIDTEEDWVRAELIMEALASRGGVPV